MGDRGRPRARGEEAGQSGDAPLLAHPAADVFPLMSGYAFEELVKDIALRGQQVPVVLHRGRVLDGRNRVRACERLGIRPVLIERDDLESPTAYVLSLNLHRRHMTPAQKAAVAVLAKAEFAKEAGDRQRQAGGDRRPLPDASSGSARPRAHRHRGEWSAHAARATGAGVTAVKTLDAVRRNAPEVFEAVHGGVVASVRDAKRVAELPSAQRVAVIDRLRLDPRVTVRTALLELKRQAVLSRLRPAAPSGSHFTLVQGDAAKVSRRVGAGSCGLVLADPPYNHGAVSLYGAIGRVAARVLRPGGSLLVMTGQAWLPEVFEAIRPHLTYRWTMCFLLAGEFKTPVWSRSIVSEWKAILWFVKGQFTGRRILTDVLSASAEKQLHAWQQPEDLLATLVEWFSEPGEVVLDPCCGTGTTGAAALKEGRRFVGIDIDGGMLRLAASRLASAASDRRQTKRAARED